MMLEVTIGESICVRMDDGMEDQRLNPEQTEDYLRRMGRQAVTIYNDLPTATLIVTDGDSED